MKDRVEKHCSSSTLPNTITTEISTNVKYFNNRCCSTTLEAKLDHKSRCIAICSLLFLATMQACIAPNAFWVKRKNRCMWLARDLRAYATRVVWKVFAWLGCLVCNTMDNKHERGCLCSDLCCHTNVNTYKQSNPIITKRNQLITYLLHGQAPISHQ